MGRYSALVLFFILLPFFALGQQPVVLHFKDAKSDHEIAYVQVEVTQLSGSKPRQKMYTADYTGRVTCELPLPLVIKARSLGHKEVCDTILTAQGEHIVKMVEDPFLMEEVVVTGTRSMRLLKNSPVITRLITADQIKARGISDVRELLTQEIPGMAFNVHGDWSSASLQGLEAKHLLFLIDGQRLAGESGANIDYERINMQNVERVEIIQGAASSLYGSQAMGAVLNFITKKPRNTYSISGSVKYTNFYDRNFKNPKKNGPFYIYQRNLDHPNLDLNLSAGLQIEDWRARTALRRITRDAYRLYDTKGVKKYYPKLNITQQEPLNEEPVGLAGSQTYSLSQMVGYKPLRNLDFEGNFDFSQIERFDFQRDGKFTKARDFSGILKGDYDPLDNLKLNAAIHVDYYQRGYQHETEKDYDIIYKNNMIQPQFSAQYRPHRDHLLTMGTDALIETLFGDRFNADSLESRRQVIFNIFAQEEYSILENLNLVGGFRMDLVDKRVSFTPKVALMWRVRPVTMRLNYAMGFRQPTLKERYMNWSHLGMFMIVGDPNLRPETNHYISLSGELATEWCNITLVGYANFFKDKIAGSWNADGSEMKYYNEKSSSYLGLQSNGKFKIIRGLYLHYGYSFQHVIISKDAFMLTVMSPHTGTLRAEYAFGKPRWKTHVNFGAQFVGRKKFYVEDIHPLNDTLTAYREVNIRMLHLWNVSVTQHLTRYVSLTLGVNNLFDYRPDQVSFNSTTSPRRHFFAEISFNI